LVGYKLAVAEKVSVIVTDGWLGYNSIESLGSIIMLEKMDRTKIVIAKQNEFDEMDDLYWAKASKKEKLQTVTFLRECFYGEEATTGRLQRFYQILKF